MAKRSTSSFSITKPMLILFVMNLIPWGVATILGSLSNIPLSLSSRISSGIGFVFSPGILGLINVVVLIIALVMLGIACSRATLTQKGYVALLITSVTANCWLAFWYYAGMTFYIDFSSMHFAF
jgi:hypothetical protein